MTSSFLRLSEYFPNLLLEPLELTELNCDFWRLSRYLCLEIVVIVRWEPLSKAVHDALKRLLSKASLVLIPTLVITPLIQVLIFLPLKTLATSLLLSPVKNDCSSKRLSGLGFNRCVIELHKACE